MSGEQKTIWDVDKIDVLLKSYGLQYQHLSRESIQLMRDAGRIETRSDGETIAFHHRPVDDLFFILSGHIMINSHGYSGREHMVAIMEPGAVFGLLGVLDRQINPHNAVTVGPTEFLVLPGVETRRLIDTNSEFRWEILTLMCTRLRYAFSIMEEFALASPRSRLASRLCSLGNAYGIPSNGGLMINLDISQDTLGAMIGISRQATNKHIKQFEKENLIIQKLRKFIIQDFYSLEKIGLEN